MIDVVKQIPSPVIRRLPKYLSHVQKLRKEHVEWASSQDLADSLGLTSSTVRQDLSHVDLSGISKKGYETVRLEETLRGILGADKVHKVVIVGAGRLGLALAVHGELAERGFEICGILDNNPKKVGKKVEGYTIQDVKQLARMVKSRKVSIGIIAVPSAAAQEIAERLAAAGVSALLNLAYTHIRVQPDIKVVDARILESLQELAFSLQSRRAEKVKK